MKPHTRLGILVGVLALVGIAVLASPAATPEAGEPDDPTRSEASVTFVEPAPNASVQLWPHTSRVRSLDRAELPINVVVRADAATVRRLLTAEGTVGWNATGGARGGAPGAVDGEDRIGIEWSSGHGADRYTYVRTADGGRWLAQTAQLNDGSYFGTQYHLRLYGAETGETAWTAVQAHHEHWDWFRLRHTVDSVSDAQRHVEGDLFARAVHEDISRVRYANGGAVDADGWVTVVDLRPDARPRADAGDEPGRPNLPPDAAVLGLAGLGFGLVARARLDPERSVGIARITGRHAALFGATALLMPAVRAGGIAAEEALPGVSPYLVGSPFFLALVLGYPALAVAFGRRLPSEDAFAAAVLGMGTGIMVDYAYLGVGALPYDAIVHRLVLLFGLGLLAAGGTRWAADPLRRHRYRLVGGVVWVGAILFPLSGF